MELTLQCRNVSFVIQRHRQATQGLICDCHRQVVLYHTLTHLTNGIWENHAKYTTSLSSSTTFSQNQVDLINRSINARYLNEIYRDNAYLKICFYRVVDSVESSSILNHDLLR